MYSDMPAEKNEYDIINETMLIVNIRSATRLDKTPGGIFEDHLVQTSFTKNINNCMKKIRLNS